jgi:hypothetical protein
MVGGFAEVVFRLRHMLRSESSRSAVPQTKHLGARRPRNERHANVPVLGATAIRGSARQRGSSQICRPSGLAETRRSGTRPVIDADYHSHCQTHLRRRSSARTRRHGRRMVQRRIGAQVTTVALSPLSGSPVKTAPATKPRPETCRKDVQARRWYPGFVCPHMCRKAWSALPAVLLSHCSTT